MEFTFAVFDSVSFVDDDTVPECRANARRLGKDPASVEFGVASEDDVNHGGVRVVRKGTA